MSEVRGKTWLQECYVEFDLENTWPEAVMVLKQIEQQGMHHW